MKLSLRERKGTSRPPPDPLPPTPPLPTLQLFLHEWKASQHDECIVSIKVLSETNSGQHKVKVAGIMVSVGQGRGSG